MDMRKGPWTLEEDAKLANYITAHGEGRWNSVAHRADLKRTGKSCRLRWLNYLRPDVRRGNITLQEQLLILDLHSRWGNRWSRIAQQLPGRTDNEIKNFWRTRVVKQAKQLKCDVHSKQFGDAMRHVWMPRLLERIMATSEDCPAQFRSSSWISQSDIAHARAPNPCDYGSQWMHPNDVSCPSSDTSTDLEGVRLTSNSDRNERCDHPMFPHVVGSDGLGDGSNFYPLAGVHMTQAFEQDDIFGGGESQDSWWNEENLLFTKE